MQPAAQIQASIELLEKLTENRRPADRVLAHYFKQRRYIGAKDKKAIAEQFYAVVRTKMSLEYLLKQVSLDASPRLLVAANLVLEGTDLSQFFDGGRHHPSRFGETQLASLGNLNSSLLEQAPGHVRLNVPEWIESRLQIALGDHYEEEMLAQNQQANTDIRVNTLKVALSDLQAELDSHQLDYNECDISPIGLRFVQRLALFNLKAFKQGHFEVQDEGSQLLALATGAKAGDRVVDFCAGAGGKSLALAAMMQNKGSIYACDVHSKRLEELQRRAKRAGAHNVRTHVLSSENDKWVKQHKLTADIVLIDAPCTGTGTWRRNPDSRWNLLPESLENLCRLQQSILQSAARLVKPGGKLFYATCSLLNEENETQIEQFLLNNPHFSLSNLARLDYLTEHAEKLELKPHSMRTFTAKTGTDGFYLCALERLVDIDAEADQAAD